MVEAAQLIFTFQYVSIKTLYLYGYTYMRIGFTFQYVSIKTIKDTVSDFKKKVFTFQYVSIKTYESCKIATGKCDLHSNMFLLRRT